ncbi:MAG: 2-phospho-L-lactate guanylyltransferase [Jatrophihabitantaceae bacterium]
MRWTVVVPLRALPSAKSRLAASVPPEVFERLVTAIRADTLAAARAAAPVARVVVVGDAPGANVTLVQTSRGLNGALRDGAAHASARWPADGVAALVGDLPSVRPEELAAALDAAAGHRCAFVADRPGTGTTLLTARPGVPLDPRFGTGSAARHASIAAELDAGPGLRHDVDTADDLAAAARVGLGARTAALIGRDVAIRRSS